MAGESELTMRALMVVSQSLASRPFSRIIHYASCTLFFPVSLFLLSVVVSASPILPWYVQKKAYSPFFSFFFLLANVVCSTPH